MKRLAIFLMAIGSAMAQPNPTPTQFAALAYSNGSGGFNYYTSASAQLAPFQPPALGVVCYNTGLAKWVYATTANPCSTGGSGSGTVNSGTANQIAKYAATGTAVSGDSTLTDDGTTLTYSGTGGISTTGGGINTGPFQIYSFHLYGAVDITNQSLTSGRLVQTGAAGIEVDGPVAANVVNASSPGAGIAHFAGSTQTVTSSAVSLTAEVFGVLSVANGGTNTAAPGITCTYTASGTTTFAAASALVAGCSFTATHSTTTTFSPTNLVAWGSYTAEVKQDSTGGGNTFTLGTGGSCASWRKPGGGGAVTTLTLSTVANNWDVLAFSYDGTNCIITQGTNY